MYAVAEYTQNRDVSGGRYETGSICICSFSHPRSDIGFSRYEALFTHSKW
jgi:hypothetical protein